MTIEMVRDYALKIMTGLLEEADKHMPSVDFSEPCKEARNLIARA